MTNIFPPLSKAENPSYLKLTRIFAVLLYADERIFSRMSGVKVNGIDD